LLPPASFPAGYDSTDNVAVELPRTLISLLAQGISQWEHRRYWESDSDYESGHQAALLLQERLVTGTAVDYWQLLHSDLNSITLCSQYTAFLTKLELLSTAAMAKVVPDCLPSELIAYWKLDDSGILYHDSVSDNHLSGTVNNTTGVIGNATQFVGANDHVISSDSPDLNISANQDFAISLWFRHAAPAPTGIETFIGKGYFNDVDGSWYIFLEDNGTGSLGFTFTDQPSSSALLYRNTIAMNLCDGLWHHIVVNFDRDSTADIYIDTVLHASLPISTHPGALESSRPFRLGAQSASISGITNSFTGDMDEVGIWGRLLPTINITALNNSGNALTFPFA
jgi:hypothetical protein